MGVQAGHGTGPPGAARVRRTRVVVLAVLGVAAVVAALAVAFTLTRGDTVQVVTRAFTLTPEATLTFEVVKPAGSTASCDLRARDRESVEVGRRSGVLVGPAPGRSVVVTEVVPTSAVPTVVEVESCTLVR